MHYQQKVLYTPGPLCTSKEVKDAMLVDLGTRDKEYSQLTSDVQTRLLALAGIDAQVFHVVFLQGSGTYGVESVINSSIGEEDHLLILSNGAYGQRMAQIAKQAKRSYEIVEFDMLHALDVKEIEQYIAKKEVTHVAFVHDETTAGVLNDQKAICAMIKAYGKVSIVDAMSSFGGIPMDFENADFVITSSNKCLHGVPGIAIVFARVAQLANCVHSPSLSLDLYAQDKALHNGSGFRFTSPTHVMLALQEAIEELYAFGGIAKRHERYCMLQKRIASFMHEEGFVTLVESAIQAPIITTYQIPTGFDFDAFYTYLKVHGILLYSGKLPGIEAFRIGNIGEISDNDMDALQRYVHAYCQGDRI